MFDSIQDFNQLILLAVLLIVTTGYLDRKVVKWRMRKRRRQYRNLTRPTAAARDAGSEAGGEPR